MHRFVCVCDPHVTVFNQRLTLRLADEPVVLTIAELSTVTTWSSWSAWCPRDSLLWSSWNWWPTVISKTTSVCTALTKRSALHVPYLLTPCGRRASKHTHTYTHTQPGVSFLRDFADFREKRTSVSGKLTFVQWIRHVGTSKNLVRKCFLLQIAPNWFLTR